MLKTKKLFVLVFLLLNCILFSACSQSKEVDFVKKYKIDLNTISDVTEVLQKAIDELHRLCPDGLDGMNCLMMACCFCRTEHIRWQVESCSKKI